MHFIFLAFFDLGCFLFWFLSLIFLDHKYQMNFYSVSSIMNTSNFILCFLSPAKTKILSSKDSYLSKIISVLFIKDQYSLEFFRKSFLYEKVICNASVIDSIFSLLFFSFFCRLPIDWISIFQKKNYNYNSVN